LIESSATLAKVRGDQLIPIELPTCEEEIEVLTPQNNGAFWNTSINNASTAELE
jgi:hypothetical protein